MNTDLCKLGVKIFLANPDALDLRAVIPVFHRWIQEQQIGGHLLIDVHDYSHVPDGPGILLVAHEGNFSVDRADGRPGLSYYRKLPLAGGIADRLAGVVQIVLQASRLLEADPKLNGIKFRTDELVVIANDRLLAPNTLEAQAQLRSAIRQAFGPETVVRPHSPDPRDRLALLVNLPPKRAAA